MLVAGLAVGVATSYLQGVLPASADFLANSGAAWSVFAFAFVLAAAAGGGRGQAAVAGLAALLGEVVGYYGIASPLRHIATSSEEHLLWTAAALVVGPIVGWLAWTARHEPPTRRVAAVAAVAGVVAGEGAHALLRLGYHVQGSLELAVAAVAAIAGLLLLGRTWAAARAGAAAALAAAIVVYLAYGVA